MSTNNPIDTIHQFNKLAGNTDDRFNPRQAAMYMGLQCEELAEKFNSLGFSDRAEMLDNIGAQFKDGTFDFTFEECDRHAILDDDVDLLVVTVGSLLSQGVDIPGALGEVNRANMAKVFPDGTMHRDENGKIIKPDGWTPPDLTPFLAEA